MYTLKKNLFLIILFLNAKNKVARIFIQNLYGYTTINMQGAYNIIYIIMYMYICIHSHIKINYNSMTIIIEGLLKCNWNEVLEGSQLSGFHF